MRWPLVLLAVGTAAAASLTASSSPALRSADAALAHASATCSHRGGTLTVLSNNDVDNIDPGISWDIFSWTYVTYVTQRQLYRSDPSDPARLIPDIASGPPAISDGGKTITVHLKPNVMFSPPVNRAVTSADVQYGLERGFSKNVANPYASLSYNLVGVKAFTDGTASHIAGIVTPNTTTVVFHLTTPTPTAFLDNLLNPLASPVPADYAAQFDKQDPSTYGQHQAATGPYMIQNDSSGKLTGYDPGRQITLVRNPNWNASSDSRPACVDRIVESLGNSDATVASQRVTQGSGMITGNFEPPAAVSEAAATSNNGRDISIAPTTKVWYVSLNTKVPPLNNLNVRKAILAGFDRAAMWKVAGGRFAGQIASHLIPPEIAGFAQAGGVRGPRFDYLSSPNGNLALARTYMKKAGYPSGKYTGSHTLLMYGASNAPETQEAQVIKAQLGLLGLKVNLKIVDRNAMYDKYCNVVSQKVALCAGDWAGVDAYQQLYSPFDGKAIVPTGNSNYSLLNDPTINHLFDVASVTSNTKKSAQLYGLIDRDIMGQAAAIPWLWSAHVTLHSSDVHAVVGGLFGTADLTATSVG